jgi:putative spermidine/putrescine transport system permease protein
VFLLMPLVAVIPVSFTPTRFLSIPTDEWSLRHYRALVENPQWAQGAWLSVKIGLSPRWWRRRWPWRSASASGCCAAVRGLLMGLALLPMVAPPVVSALTLYFLLITLASSTASSPSTDGAGSCWRMR